MILEAPKWDFTNGIKTNARKSQTQVGKVTEVNKWKEYGWNGMPLQNKMFRSKTGKTLPALVAVAVDWIAYITCIYLLKHAHQTGWKRLKSNNNIFSFQLFAFCRLLRPKNLRETMRVWRWASATHRMACGGRDIGISFVWLHVVWRSKLLRFSLFFSPKNAHCLDWGPRAPPPFEETRKTGAVKDECNTTGQKCVPAPVCEWQS